MEIKGGYYIRYRGYDGAWSTWIKLSEDATIHTEPGWVTIDDTTGVEFLPATHVQARLVPPTARERVSEVQNGL